ncbi:hypothetical protein OROMI_033856 [Orobanche minor]
MGRLDPNAVQYEFNQTHEDEAPMDDDEEICEDLYEPHNSNNDNTHDNDDDEDYILNDEKPPPQQQQPPQVIPQAFPPPQELVDDLLPFPPASHDDHQMNFHHHHHHHQQQQPRPVQPQPNSSNNIINGMQQFQQHSAFGQPVHEMPYGTSPSPLIPQLLLNQPWKTHLFDCMRDPENAIITFLFPCLTFGQIAEILDSGNTTCARSGIRYGLIGCCLLMPCIMSSTYRAKIRGRFRIIESPAPDWLVHCFCECCALCQEYRELQERGH